MWWWEFHQDNRKDFRSGFLVSPSHSLSVDERFMRNAASDLLGCQNAPPCVQNHSKEGSKIPPIYDLPRQHCVTTCPRDTLLILGWVWWCPLWVTQETVTVTEVHVFRVTRSVAGKLAFYRGTCAFLSVCPIVFCVHED